MANTIPLSQVQMLPAHGPEFQQQEANAAFSYLGTHIIYVAIFLCIVVVIYWTGGNKAAFWFLVLVLLGQLVTNVSEIQNLLPKG